jgi:hypothetical protein
MLALRQLMSSEPQLKVRLRENANFFGALCSPVYILLFLCFTGYTTHLFHGQQHQRF